MNVGNGKNIQNCAKLFRKWGAAEVRWYANNFTENEERDTAVEIQKRRFNSYEEYGWMLFLDTAWNHKPSQASFLSSENDGT